jgi:hypothetical protein
LNLRVSTSGPPTCTAAASSPTIPVVWNSGASAKTTPCQDTRNDVVNLLVFQVRLAWVVRAAFGRPLMPEV